MRMRELKVRALRRERLQMLVQRLVLRLLQERRPHHRLLLASQVKRAAKRLTRESSSRTWDSS